MIGKDDLYIMKLYLYYVKKNSYLCSFEIR